MTSYGGVDIVGEAWGFDTAMLGVLTDEQLARMFATPIASGPGAGRFFEFCWGYAPLPGNASKWDLTGPRMRAIADMTNGAGVAVKAGLVQHCRSGAWVASAAQGAADGQHAAEYASAQGYTPDCDLAVDDESLKNPGPDAIAHFTAWCRAWQAACLYEGFSPGMSAQEEYELPDVLRYWGAVGPWDVAVRGVCCRQQLQTTHCGIGIDPDLASPDKLGGVLRLFGRLPDVNTQTPDPSELPTKRELPLPFDPTSIPPPPPDKG